MPDERRHDPDALLAAARAAEARSGRGELRVYLGMCPGVGKTYTMLAEGRSVAKTGRTVLVGIAETHGRSETEALLGGLDVLPRRTLSHRGATLSEFDVDGALGRQPSLVLIDELAHTNAPGSRHPKRWQDVRELLDAGIDVWTTVNVQHVESLRDDVAKISGVRVQETVPDSFFDLADEIRLVDLTPDQLRERLRDGKVYLGDRAEAAAANFFREGNLTALREMALRYTAQRVDRELRDYMRRNLIVGPWRPGERLLVAIGASPYSERLIRLTRRLAGTLQASWLAVHVETGALLDDAARGRLATNLALARSLGAEVISVDATDAATGILQVATRENVSQIVAGKPVGLPWWQRLTGRSIADRLARESGDVDVLLVHPVEEKAGRAERARATRDAGRWKDWLVAAGVLAATSVVGLLAQSWIGYRSVPMLYLLVVTLSGLFLRRWPVLLLAVGSSLAWNFFFTEPRGTFAMFNREDVFLLVAFLAVAIVLGHLTTRLLRREQASHEGEERARVLYQLTRAMAASVDFEQGARLALHQIGEVFQVESVLLLSHPQRGLEPLVGLAIGENERSVCLWAFEHGRPAGRFTDTLPATPILALPLLTMGQPAGVLAVRPRDESLRSPLRRDLLDAFAAHLTVLLEKENLQRASREARVNAASQKLQRALLDHVSHELKTPVAVIVAAVGRLRAGATNEPVLLDEVHQATARLNRVVTQLVTLSRMEAGLIEPQMELCDARDLLNEVVSGLGEAASRVRVTCEDFAFRTDPNLLHTAISNLLTNAVQHAPPDTPVLLHASRHDDTAEFAVSDHGPGIPDAERNRLFERFARGTLARPGGMGLGLSIARHFIEALGGSLELESGAGDGSTFRIRLPSAQAEAPIASPT